MTTARVDTWTPQLEDLAGEGEPFVTRKFFLFCSRYLDLGLRITFAVGTPGLIGGGSALDYIFCIFETCLGKAKA